MSIERELKEKKFYGRKANIGSALSFSGNYGVVITDCTIPQCYFYRIEQKKRILEKNGITLDVFRSDEISKVLDLLKFSSFLIVYRTPMNRNLKRMILEANRNSVPVIYEVDDLIFNVKILVKDPNFRVLSLRNQISLIRDSFRQRKIMRISAGSIASTESLKKEMLLSGSKDVMVFPNCIDEYQLQLVSKIQKQDSHLSIYFPSGSSSHDANFRSAASGIASYLVKNPTATLKINENIRLPRELIGLNGRVLRLPWLSYSSYLFELSMCSLVINPLVKNDFNVCKSNIKEMEAALTQTPFLGSSLIYNNYISLNREETNWAEVIERKLANPRVSELEVSHMQKMVVEAIEISDQVSDTFKDFITSLRKKLCV
jgi:hypothetical protein